ncbi:MAG TPA: Gfo/Idh/MocA family oxidoreductase, partial [Vicinamibacterales bacterium]|nr:Gfo/Idh/MocA family oxidoreductase [Vicinamibacterales bacterium]
MLNVGLIGYGYWGPNLARNFADADGVRLTTIADARPERRQAAERRHPGVKTCADDAGLIQNADVDAVV